MKPVRIACAATALIAVLLYVNSFAGSATTAKPGVGDLAPAFVAEDLDGGKVSLEELSGSGKVVILNFWGLRCSTCIEEIAYLNPLYEKYRGQGVVFLGVNVDGAKGDAIRKLMPAMANVPLFTVLPDPDFRISDMYNMLGAPITFVIGRDSKVLSRHEDFKPGDEKGLEETLLKAVAAAR